MHSWTQHQIDYIKLICWQRYKKDITVKFNNHFKTNLSEAQISGIMKKYKIHNGVYSKFKKGITPHNKGKKMPSDIYAKLRPTMFQKGNTPAVYRPVGSERITKDGYTEVKIADPNHWELKQRYIYEQAYGKIPKKDIIVFLDGNRRNFELNNLRHITRKENLYINRHKLRFNDRDMTEAGANVARLALKVMDLEKNE